jgi:hypothetical protein
MPFFFLTPPSSPSSRLPKELALAEAVKKEDYVTAASLKDEIAVLKAGGSSTVFESG